MILPGIPLRAAGTGLGPHPLALPETSPSPSAIRYGVWTNAHPLSNPSLPSSGAIWYTMAYSPDADRFLLVTANDQGPEQAWVYDAAANAWTALPAPSPSPAIRPQASLVYDDAVHRFVLFGAYGPQPFGGAYGANETWLYDLASNTWTNVTPRVSPPIRYGQAMVYVPDTAEVLLFGGTYVTCDPQGCNVGVQGWALNDTWVFDAATDTWTNVTPLSSPGGGPSVQMVYDPVAHVVFLDDSSNLGMWLYDPATDTWQPDGVGSPGSPGTGSTMAYDPAMGVVVAFGGYVEGSLSNGTWWCNLTAPGWGLAGSLSAPSARGASTMAYDSRTGLLVLLGGFTLYGSLADTWTYGPGTPPPLSVVATGSPLQGPSPLIVGFRAIPRSGVPPFSYRWDFGDGSTATGVSPPHAFRDSGDYTVRLTVTDGSGNTTTTTVVVAVGPAAATSAAQPLAASFGASWAVVAGTGAIAAVAAYTLLGPRRPRRPEEP